MTKQAKSIDHKLIGRQVLQKLTEEQWLDLLDRLTLFINSYYFDVDCKDSIQEAILAVIDGRRSWDLNKTPFNNLCLIIRSITSNQLAKDRRFTCLDPDVENPTCDTAAMRPLNLSHTELYERRESDENFMTRLHESLQGDDLSVRVTNHLLEDDTRWKPQKIAEHLGEPVRAINNARKRLRRRLKALLVNPNKAL